MFGRIHTEMARVQCYYTVNFVSPNPKIMKVCMIDATIREPEEKCSILYNLVILLLTSLNQLIIKFMVVNNMIKLKLKYNFTFIK